MTVPLVLFLDDDPMRNDRVKTTIERAGFEVESALTVADCMQKLTARSYTVLLLDIMVPHGDDTPRPVMQAGVDLVQQIREGKVAGVPADLPIVVFTATTGYRAQLEALGVDGYCQKPCSMRLVIEQLEAARRGAA